ncbi:MAG: hypothetical protein MK136_06410 [Pirellulaceae bacterium]|nr:hypothetical protein [Pirellulaceae bacterium]
MHLSIKSHDLLIHFKVAVILLTLFLGLDPRGLQAFVQDKTKIGVQALPDGEASSEMAVETGPENESAEPIFELQEEMTEDEEKESPANSDPAKSQNHAQADPSWIHRGDYTDVERAVDHRLVFAGGHSQMSECETAFKTEVIRVTRDYVDEILGIPGGNDKVDLVGKPLKDFLDPQRTFKKEHVNEFGIAYLKYGQLAFTESFRKEVDRQYRESVQESRMVSWVAGFACLLGAFALVSLILKKRA